MSCKSICVSLSFDWVFYDVVVIDAQGFFTFASSVSILLAFGWLLRSRPLPLIPDVLGERETVVYGPSPCDWLHNFNITCLSFSSPKNTKDEFTDSWVTSSKGLLCPNISYWKLSLKHILYNTFSSCERHSNMNNKYIAQWSIAITCLYIHM